MIGVLSRGESMHELSLALTFVIVHCSTCSSVYYMLLVLRPPAAIRWLIKTPRLVHAHISLNLKDSNDTLGRSI